MAKALLAVTFLIFSFLATTSLEAAAPKKQLPWNELSAGQQEILSPLFAGWDDLDTSQKRKWLGIAKRYPAMKPTEQENVRRRMQDWASLTPVQRQAARDRYRKLEKLPPEKKQALPDKWAEYQQLPESEREKLRSAAKGRKTASPRARNSATPSSATVVPQ